MNNFKVMMNGIIKENPTFVLLLGMCPTLGTTSSAINGMGMGLATMFVLICSNVVISLIKNLIPDMVRIPSFIVVIASFVTLLQMVMQAYVPGLYATLGLFIPLIVVNCIVLGRAEAFAAKNNAVASMFDGIGMGLGFTIALTLLGARYGNVMCSRGSVIPLWIDQIRNGNPITLTEPKMTRFIMSLEEAVDLVLFAFEHGQNGDILVQKAPACTIQTQAEAVCELFGGKKEDIKVIGIRHGEKMYETLLTNEECAKAEDMGDFYRVPADNRGLNYDKFFKEGEAERNTLTEFNSDNTRRLNLEETKAKIAALEYIQKELTGEGNFVQ